MAGDAQVRRLFRRVLTRCVKRRLDVGRLVRDGSGENDTRLSAKVVRRRDNTFLTSQKTENCVCRLGGVLLVRKRRWQECRDSAVRTQIARETDSPSATLCAENAHDNTLRTTPTPETSV